MLFFGAGSARTASTSASDSFIRWVVRERAARLISRHARSDGRFDADIRFGVLLNLYARLWLLILLRLDS
jgi:hypothetical protein